MKKHASEFILRGLMAAAGGPVILAIVYGILGTTGTVESLLPSEVCRGILTITLMAFIAAGITAIYTVERLPLSCAILIHGAVLYLDYLMIYMLNDWMPKDITVIGIFTVIFAIGFGLVWLLIYLLTKAKTDSINRKLIKV